MSSFSTTTLIYFLSPDDTFNLPKDPSRKQRTLISVRLPLPGVCIGVQAHTEEKYSVPGLHVEFKTKKQTIQLNGLLKKNGLQNLVKRRY